MDFARVIVFIFVIIILSVMMFFIFKNNYISERLKLIKLRMLIAVGKDDEARKFALKMIEQFPKNYEAHKILGSLYERQGNFNIALDEYIRAVEIDGKDLTMHYKVAELLQKNDRNEDAIIMLQDVLKMKPDYLEASKLLGNILYDEEQFKEAISVYMYALRYNPADYELYYNLGMTFTRINDFQKAKEFYKKAAKINTYLYNGQYNLALIEMIQGELEKAEQYLQQAIQEEELEPMAYFYLAHIAIMKNEKLKAVDYLNLALELDIKIKDKIENQPIFAPIQDKIRIPNQPRKRIKIKLSEKERKTNKYLEEMYNLVDSLNGGNFINEMKEEQQNEIQIEEQKERE